MILQRALGVTYQRILEKNYLLQQNDQYEISDDGLEIWRLLNGEYSTEDIFILLAEKFDTDIELYRADIELFFQFLQENNLVVVKKFM
ncbi:hypothetical protein AMQ84_04655 [Paenibacillus riograndensis]|uniref:Uncharacterized protein n=1 Tax=Paenibacillus riograndensis TaxID=483937 RepID=A0A132UA28_9BACL|nr:PqqD family protein [Paenibacillus riograndensis]KWX80173.1 hypothetical protein AMQ84_04655 [Paenibacillus riograndensis]